MINLNNMKNILLYQADLLGERMSLIDDNAQNNQNTYIRTQLMLGLKAEVIARTAEVPLSRVKEIERDMKE